METSQPIRGIGEPRSGNDRPAPRPDETVTKTGTTTVALAVADGVVLASDRRASIGGGRFVSNKDVRKIEKVHPAAALTISGSVGGAQAFVRTIRAEVELYRTRRGREMGLDALATLTGNLLRRGQFMFTPLLAGLDESGGRVFEVDGAGGVMRDDYAASGSGMQLAYGVLEAGYDPDLSFEEARTLASRAIESAVERDTASGNGITLAGITAEGVTIDAGDGAEVR